MVQICLKWLQLPLYFVFIMTLNPLSFMFKLQLTTSRKLKIKSSHYISDSGILWAYAQAVERSCAHLIFCWPLSLLWVRCVAQTFHEGSHTDDTPQVKKYLPVCKTGITLLLNWRNYSDQESTMLKHLSMLAYNVQQQ